MNAHDDVQTSTIALIGLLGTLGLLVIVLLLVVVYYQAQSRQQYQKDVAVPYLELEDLVADQQAQLVEYRWIDQENQVVAVPIGRAMELVVAELSSEQRAGKRAGLPGPGGPAASAGAAAGPKTNAEQFLDHQENR